MGTSLNHISTRITGRLKLGEEKRNSLKAALNFCLFLCELMILVSTSAFPSPGKCSYYILPSSKTFTGVANDPQAIHNTNYCPQSSSSFRVSLLAKLTADVPTSESPILFAYHNIIQVFIKRDGAGHKLQVFKTGEVSGGLLFSEPIGKVNWIFFLFLQVTPAEAHLALRSWKNYAHEFHRKWKKSFSKPKFSLVILIV